MRIRKIKITLDVQEKIFKKHNLRREEIEGVFFDEPLYFHTKDKRYMAIGFIDKYVTVVFYYEGDAVVITAYESSKWQRNLYNVKRWKK